MRSFDFSYASATEGNRSGTITSFVVDMDEAMEAVKARLLMDTPDATDIQVNEQPKNGGYPFAVDQLIALIQKDRPDLSTEHMQKHDWLILNTDRDSYRRGGYVLPMHEAKHILADEDGDYDDFVYLRKYGVVLINVGRHTSHEIFTNGWYWIESVLLKDTTKTMDDADYSMEHDEGQEKFLHDQCGFFMSRAFNMRTVHKSANMRLTAAEKMIFGHFDFRNLEP